MLERKAGAAAAGTSLEAASRSSGFSLTICIDHLIFHFLCCNHTPPCTSHDVNRATHLTRGWTEHQPWPSPAASTGAVRQTQRAATLQKVACNRGHASPSLLAFQFLTITEQTSFQCISTESIKEFHWAKWQVYRGETSEPRRRARIPVTDLGLEAEVGLWPLGFEISHRQKRKWDLVFLSVRANCSSGFLNKPPLTFTSIGLWALALKHPFFPFFF